MMNFFGRRRGAEVYSKSELLSDKSSFAITEAYKSMRTNLLFLLTEGRRVVAFTSTLEAEGKTTTCLNAAISFAQLGHRVVVIDMDMRRPRLHKYFGVSSSPGLSDRLGGFTKELTIVPTEYENVSIVPVGTIPPSPSDLLMTPAFDKVIEELKDKFDYVFLDTPPSNVVNDLSVVANRLDGVVFIVRENTSSYEMIKQCLLNLERAGAKVLGFVLNDSTSDSTYYHYRYRRKTGSASGHSRKGFFFGKKR